MNNIHDIVKNFLLNLYSLEFIEKIHVSELDNNIVRRYMIKLKNEDFIIGSTTTACITNSDIIITKFFHHDKNSSSPVISLYRASSPELFIEIFNMFMIHIEDNANNSLEKLFHGNVSYIAP